RPALAIKIFCNRMNHRIIRAYIYIKTILNVWKEAFYVEVFSVLCIGNYFLHTFSTFTSIGGFMMYGTTSSFRIVNTAAPSHQSLTSVPALCTAVTSTKY